MTGGNLTNYGIRVPGNRLLPVFYISGFDAPSRLKGGDLDFKHFKMSNSLWVSPPLPRAGKIMKGA